MERKISPAQKKRIITVFRGTVKVFGQAFFKRLAVSKGSAFGRPPQRTKSLRFISAGTLAGSLSAKHFHYTYFREYRKKMLHFSFARYIILIPYQKNRIRRCDGIGRRAGLKILIAVSPGETRKPLYIKAFDNRINRVFSKSPSKSPSDFRRLLFETVRKRIYAGVMELADVLDSKSSGGDTVRVRPPPPAPSPGNPCCIRVPGFSILPGK